MNFGCMLENSPNNHNLNNIDLQFFLNKNALLLESRVGYTPKWQRPGISLSCHYTILNKTLGSRYKDQLSCLHSNQEDRGHRSLIFSFYGHRNPIRHFCCVPLVRTKSPGSPHVEAYFAWLCFLTTILLKERSGDTEKSSPASITQRLPLPHLDDGAAV